MANSFMSGLISGFMAFGGGGAIGGAAGGAGSSAAGAGASAAGSSGASSAGASAAGGENIGTTSQALSTGDSGGSTPAFSTSGGGSSSGGSGDIIRENPYGSGPTDTGPSKGQQAVSNALGKLGQGLGSAANAPDSQISMNMPQGNAYNALFGVGAANAGGLTGSQIGSINAPATPISQPNPIPGMAPITPPPQAAPLQIPMQYPNPQPAPSPQLGMVSDMRAKQNIKYANADMDKFLNSVYDNISKRKK